jgi:hypothetical protein
MWKFVLFKFTITIESSDLLLLNGYDIKKFDGFIQDKYILFYII